GGAGSTARRERPNPRRPPLPSVADTEIATTRREPDMSREDIEFKGEGDVTLRGWFYPARNTTAPAPVIVLSHGLTAVKEMHIGPYAEVFAAAGLNAIVYDHQNFGGSDGLPRQEAEPV